MVKLKHSDRRMIKRYFESQPGYVLDFSNKTFAEFFEDEFSTDIYSDSFASNGTSKSNRLFCYLEQASARQAGIVLRALWNHKTEARRNEREQKSLLVSSALMDPEALEIEFLPDDLEEREFNDFASQIEVRGDDIHNAAAILAERFNFNTVMLEIDRARTFVEDDPEDAITASCSLVESVCRSILVELGIPLPRDRSIKPLYKEVREPLGLSPGNQAIDPVIAQDVLSILSALSNAVSGIGSLRTHGGDAHGRERGVGRVDARIARLAVNAASALTIFLIESWERKYPNRALLNSEQA